MKKTFFLITFVLAAICWYPSFSQSSSASFSAANNLEVGFNKTTVLLFPGNIKKVDIGSPDITARTVKIGDNERILRVKANKESDFVSSLHVFTDDGRIYSFNVRFATNPRGQTQDLAKESAIATVPTILEPRHMLAAEIRDYCAAIAHLKPKTGRPGVFNNGMRMKLSGIYVYNRVMFFQFRVANLSGIPFDLDFTRFYVRDQKTTKRSSVMEKEVTPLYIHYEKGSHIDGGQEHFVVAAFDKFTISEKKLFMAEMFEQNGDRHLQCRLKGKHILKARPLLPLSGESTPAIATPQIPAAVIQ